MLFTRCPDCETTFRITAEALRKADGQVRCGRCARVFNAYNELRRRSRKNPNRSTDESVLAGDAEVSQTLHADAANDKGAAAASAGRNVSRTSSRPEPAAVPEKTTGNEKDLVLGDISLAGVIAELKESTAPDEPGTPDPEQSGTGVSMITLLAKSGLGLGAPSRPRSQGASAAASSGKAAEAPESRGKAARAPESSSKAAQAPESSSKAAQAPQSSSKAAQAPESSSETAETPAWVMLDEPRPKRAAARAWSIGAVAAGSLLALQVMHHFRADIAALAVVGPVIQDTYAALGSEIAPHWDLEQYEVAVDWDDVAQQSADGQGHLKIAARIRNNGPRTVPLPLVQVQLKDRWESTLGSRVFAPSEYLPAGVVRNGMMIAGQTARAEFDIMDPGPQAYGFELDVCVDAQEDALRCAADEVFQ